MSALGQLAADYRATLPSTHKIDYASHVAITKLCMPSVTGTSRPAAIATVRAETVARSPAGSGSAAAAAGGAGSSSSSKAAVAVTGSAGPNSSATAADDLALDEGALTN